MNDKLLAKLKTVLAGDCEAIEAEVLGFSATDMRTLLLTLRSQLRRKGWKRLITLNFLVAVQTALSSTLPLLSVEESVELLELLESRLDYSASAAVNNRMLNIATQLLARTPTVFKSSNSSFYNLRTVSTKLKHAFLETIKRRDRVANSHRTPKGLSSSAASEMNIAHACECVANDARLDWYKDPWEWPELRWLGESGKHVVIERLRSVACGEAIRLDVPKNNASVRPAMVLDITDRVAYQALVDLASQDLLCQLPGWAFGWRLNRKTFTTAHYENNLHEWTGFRSELKRNIGIHSNSVRIDVREFFSSVQLDRFEVQLSRALRQKDVAVRLMRFLRGWQDSSGRNGLPQRCLASSVLAQMFLSPLDELISRRLVGGKLSALRWMDDLWLFADDIRVLEKVVYEVEDLLSQLGLAVNSTKTQLIENTNDAVNSDDNLDPSAIDDILSDAVDKDAAIDDVLERVLDEAEEISRSNISFLARRVNSSSEPAVLDKFEEHRERLSPAADIVAKMIARLNRWTENEAWYVGLAQERPGAADWTVAAWAEMFPREATGVGKVTECFQQKAVDAKQTVLLPIAIDRLVNWTKSSALSELSAGADEVSTPFGARAYGLGMTKAGDETQHIRRVLRSFSESSITGDALAAIGYKLPITRKGLRPLVK